MSGGNVDFSLCGSAVFVRLLDDREEAFDADTDSDARHFPACSDNDVQ